jgi:hypothetical protein
MATPFFGNDKVAISSVTGTPATVSFTGTVTLTLIAGLIGPRAGPLPGKIQGRAGGGSPSQ